MKTQYIKKNDTGTFYYSDKEMIVLHREDGPACEYSDGDKYWYQNGKYHREDGPACEYNDGSTYWYLNGKRHREDGPAVEYAHGEMVWYLDDMQYSKTVYNSKMNNCDVTVVVVDGIEYELKLKS